MSDNFGVDSDPEVFEVESIIGKMYTDGKPYYLIHWKHYEDPKYDTWEPRENLDCPEILEAFEKTEIAKKADQKYQEFLAGKYKTKSSHKNPIIQDIDEVNVTESSSTNNKKKKRKSAKKLDAVYLNETDETKISSSSDVLPNEENDSELEVVNSSKKRTKSSSRRSKPKQQKNNLPESNIDQPDSNKAAAVSKPSPKKTRSSTEASTSSKKTPSKPKETKRRPTKKSRVEESVNETTDEIPLQDTSEDQVPNQYKDDDSDFDLEAFKKSIVEEDSKKDQEFNQNAKATFILKQNSEFKSYKHKEMDYHAIYGIYPGTQLPGSLDGTAVIRFSDANQLKSNGFILAHLESGRVVPVNIEIARRMSPQKLIDCLIEEKLKIDTKKEKDLAI